MSAKFTQLQCKEVICISDGRRLGFIGDILVEVPEGKVTAVVVPGPGKLLGLGGHGSDFIIPWDCIKKIGPDIVLVDVKADECRCPRPKRGLPF
ncbi:MAG: YlmC/YmxH family sporulation protein [Oscillospiraceae bacterium]|nr:YlmC/YmxH family sporulation protein [Oscillospiraceae bacterium]